MKKRILALLLCIVMCMGVLPVTTLAARDTSYEETLAQDLKELGIMKGVSDTNFDLNRAPTRVEALVMLIRLLGKESAATNGRWNHPFTDVPSWANPYVGYAYENGLTNGISATEFGTDTATAQMYLTFMLRALGYSDKDGEDFLWNNPYILAQEVGIFPSCVNRTNFLRADVVLVSYAALAVKLKDSTKSLAQKLISEGVFTYNQFLECYDADAIINYPSGPTELTAEQLYDKCSPAVFYVEVYDNKGNATASGSGFFIDSNGTAVTNYHVIEDAYSARILTSDGAVYNVDGVYDYDVTQDWAVLKVNGSGFSSVTIGSEETVVGGATVYAIGSPLGLENTISQGLISNTNRVLDGVTYIQTSAAISHGSSGGALFNKYGEVIGITSAGFTDGENLGLALPISVIDGYSRTSVTPLSSLAGGQVPVGPGPVGGRKQEAAALLRALIRTYANENIDGDIAYTEHFDTETGYIEYSVVDGTDGDLSVLVWENFGGTYYYTSLTLDMDGDNQFLYYSYNLGESYYYEGYGMLYAPTFNENSAFSFPRGEGTADRAVNESICQGSLVDGLEYVNYLFNTYLSSYGNYSVRDFGFTSF